MFLLVHYVLWQIYKIAGKYETSYNSWQIQEWEHYAIEKSIFNARAKNITYKCTSSAKFIAYQLRWTLFKLILYGLFLHSLNSLSSVIWFLHRGISFAVWCGMSSVTFYHAWSNQYHWRMCQFNNGLDGEKYPKLNPDKQRYSGM